MQRGVRVATADALDKGAYDVVVLLAPVAERAVADGALDVGEKPSVLSAIIKAYLTELMRRCVIDAIDIRAGAAIQLGPRNTLARAYAAAGSRW